MAESGHSQRPSFDLVIISAGSCVDVPGVRNCAQTQVCVCVCVCESADEAGCIINYYSYQSILCELCEDR